MAQGRHFFTARRVTAVLVVVVFIYIAIALWRGIVLIQDGRIDVLLLGAAAMGIPLVGAWAVIREVRFGFAVQQMGRACDPELLIDDLPRTEGGRIDRAAADAQFIVRRDLALAEPDNWQRWYAVAVAYDAAGDRTRARRTMRQALEKFRASAATGASHG